MSFRSESVLLLERGAEKELTELKERRGEQDEAAGVVLEWAFDRCFPTTFVCVGVEVGSAVIR